MSECTFHIALAGNPNCGKTTLYNLLTGSAQYVGNWPGVTVEKKEGQYRHDKLDVRVVDLPGIYSLSPYSPEEIVTRNYIVNELPELIINIIDATNIERNLYLTTQLIELGRPMIIAVNMCDLLKSRGITLDCCALQKELGVPVFPISAGKNSGVDEMMHMAVHLLHDRAHTVLENCERIENQNELRRADRLHMAVHGVHENLHDGFDIHAGAKIIENGVYYENVRNFYSPEVRSVLSEIAFLLYDRLLDGIAPRFLAVKIFEGDELLLKQQKLPKELSLQLEKVCAKIPLSENFDRQMVIADQRYQFICSACARALKRTRPADARTVSDRIDSVLTNRVLAIPIFALIMALIFHLTFSERLFGLPSVPSPGVWLQGLIEELFARLSAWLPGALETIGASWWVKGLLADGIVGGVGSVLSFAPQILMLFLLLSVLEDSGYMARAAFILDKPAQKFGLSGKSFMPLLMGFGCSVPAIMGCRTLESDRDRRMTLMLVPFMSCGAKMPIYVMITAAIFPNHADVAILGIYLLGVAVAAVSGLILKSTVMKAQPMTFVMELPSYHIPGLKSLSRHLWDKLRDFLVRAGTIILGASIIIWFLSNISFSFAPVESGSADSMLGVIGAKIAVIFKPLGFALGEEGWKSVVAILSGLVAKEAVVSSASLLYGGTLPFNALQAFCFMTFNLLTIPCVAAVAAARGELRSAKRLLETLLFWFATSWIVTFLIYHMGVLLCQS